MKFPPVSSKTIETLFSDHKFAMAVTGKIAGMDVVYPLSLEGCSSTGDLFFDCDAQELRMYDQKYTFRTIYDIHNLKDLKLHKVRDNIFTCIHSPALSTFLELFLVHCLDFKDFKKYCVRKESNRFDVYVFDNEDELTQFCFYLGLYLQ